MCVCICIYIYIYINMYIICVYIYNIIKYTYIHYIVASTTRLTAGCSAKLELEADHDKSAASFGQSKAMQQYWCIIPTYFEYVLIWD